MVEGKRLLLIRLSSLGDIARLLPCLYALQEAPGVECADLTVEDRFASLLGYYPIKGCVIPYPRRSGGHPLREPLRFAEAMGDYFGTLREGRYDLAIDLHGIFRSAVVALASGAGQTAGYAKGFGKEGSHLLYSRQLAPGLHPRISRFARYAGALRAMGFPEPSGQFIRPCISEAELSEAHAGTGGALPADAPYAFFFLGTSKAQAHKRWPAAHFVALADSLFEQRGIVSVFGWGPEEAEVVEALSPAPHRILPPLLSLGATLALATRARLFVGADTGFTHLAALAGVPTVAVLGPTDPVLNAPFGSRSQVVRREGIVRGCDGAGCRHGDCMGAVTPQEVIAAAIPLMEAP